MTILTGTSLILTDTLEDDASTALWLAYTSTSAVIGGVTYIYTPAYLDDAVQVSTLSADGVLTPVTVINDTGGTTLGGAFLLEAFEVGGTPFLVVGGYDDDGITVFSLSDSAPYLTFADRVLDSDDPDTNLAGTYEIEVLTLSGGTYIYVAGSESNGISVFSVDATGGLSPVQNIDDGGTLELTRATGLSGFVLSGTQYLLATGSFDDGVSVFVVNNSTGALTEVDSFDGGATDTLNGAVLAATAVIDGTAYFYVPEEAGSALSVLAFDGSTITQVHRFESPSALSGAFDAEVIALGDRLVLSVAAQNSGQVHLFEIDTGPLSPDQGGLTLLQTLSDNMGEGELSGAADTHRVTIGDTSYLLVTSAAGSAINVYEIGGGDDLLEGDNGIDHLSGGGGDDTLIGLGNDDTLLGGAGDDLIEGGSGDDSAEGGAGADRIEAGSGDDFLRGNAGSDWMHGGSDNDTMAGNDGADTMRGGDGDDRLFGGNDDDLMAGNMGADVMSGGNGDDRLYGGAGADEIDGDNGEDMLDGGFGDDTLDGGTGEDTIHGGADNDLIDGGSSSDLIHGGSGDDSIFGGTNEDTVYGGSGNDTIDGGGSSDVLEGGSGHDSILGDSGSDLLEGGSGNDTLEGGTAFDTLLGGDGNDVLDGGANDDTLMGGDGSDDMRGGGDDDVLHGDAGRDTLRGEEGDDRLFGGEDDDTLAGNDGDDSLDGGNGDERMFGGEGNDTLIGGAGQDEMTGNGGADVFVFTAVPDSPHGATRDTIIDFEAGIDVIDLTGFGGLSIVAAYTGAGNELRYNDGIGRLYADIDGDGLSDFSVDVGSGAGLTAGDLML